MARLDKTIKDYQEQLIEKGVENIPEFIQSILNSDTTKGKYSRFLLDCYLNDKFREEDLKGGLNSTIGEAISLFHKHKSKLPEDMRSIYQYDSPGSLWNAVKQFDGQLSGKEVKREEQDRIYAETEFVYEDTETGFKIISPLTIEAAKWWGKGTRWCTSAENNNMFYRYAKKNPLLILLMPNGQKLQLWKDDGDIQFMDESDDEVESDYIEQNWNILEPIIKWIGDLKYIPERFKTEEMCKLAVEQNGINLHFVPNHFITEELCRLAVQQNGGALVCLPERYMKKSLLFRKNNSFIDELHKIAVQNNGKSIKYISTKYLTGELCQLAVQQNGDALEHIPKNMLTEEICRLAVLQNGEALKYIPEEFKTEELCKLAVQQKGTAIRSVPKHMRTEEICKLAVQQNGHALFGVPYNMITRELCEIAIKQNGSSLTYVPRIFLTKELCELAVKQNGHALFYVPKHMKTEELCKIAVQQYGNSIYNVPKQYQTEEICKIAVQQNEEALQYVPEELQEQIKQYIPPEIIEFPQEKYQQTFSEIRSFFPEKSLSLTL